MNYAVFEVATGLVVNIVVWDGKTPLSFGEEFDVVSLDNSCAGISWIYNNGVFIAPFKNFV